MLPPKVWYTSESIGCRQRTSLGLDWSLIDPRSLRGWVCPHPTVLQHQLAQLQGIQSEHQCRLAYELLGLIKDLQPVDLHLKLAHTVSSSLSDTLLLLYHEKLLILNETQIHVAPTWYLDWSKLDITLPERPWSLDTVDLMQSSHAHHLWRNWSEMHLCSHWNRLLHFRKHDCWTYSKQEMKGKLKSFLSSPT